MNRNFSSGLYLTLSLCLLLIPLSALSSDTAALSDEQRANAQLLIDDALSSDLAYSIVESLTTEVGARMAGSESEQRARQWGERLGKELGFDRVSVDKFTMPFWDRGDLAVSLTRPYDQHLHATSLGGAGASKGKIDADVVYFRSLNELQKVTEGQLKGKVAFVDGEKIVKAQTGAGYGPANQRRRVGWQHAERGGASALVVRSVGSSSHRFPHTGMMSAKDGTWATIPVIAVSNPDADQIRRLYNLGEKLEINIKSGAGWGDDTQSGNVILDLVGSETPNEIVLIGGHLDSWDLGTGAVDDGAGVAITTAAAALIAKLPKRPKRTIRVVMFGAEEVGLLGAEFYARKYAAELDNHVMATESDFGAGFIWQLNSNVSAAATSLMDEIGKVLMPLGIVRGGSNVRGGGPDIIPLDAKGVPTIRLSQNGMDYFDLHHTPDDTLDKIRPEELAQNVAAYAATIYLVADSEVDFRKKK